MIILAEFPQQTQIDSGFILCADSDPVGGERAGFFGWKYSPGMRPALAAPKVAALEIVYVKSPKTFEETMQQLTFRIERGSRVAPVTKPLRIHGPLYQPHRSAHDWLDGTLPPPLAS